MRRWVGARESIVVNMSSVDTGSRIALQATSPMSGQCRSRSFRLDIAILKVCSLLRRPRGIACWGFQRQDSPVVCAIPVDLDMVPRSEYYQYIQVSIRCGNKHADRAHCSSCPTLISPAAVHHSLARICDSSLIGSIIHGVGPN